ncbi:MAG: alpha/beta hydrolase fold domain-containing protein [Gordonia sp. (in: high G+C Gram-positive bacteria)]|uniref:alpha/beta hydrolase family protein n=1 Tax=Gordonia sp. (in: high G+C Gram-positive bacteria) TaxID=84139 RepID=UPI0039E5D76D
MDHVVALPRRHKIPYGPAPSQYGHLYLPQPSAQRAPLVVLVHGGSWSTKYALVVYSAVARDLASRGAVVWNLEYRRLEEGGGWPVSCDDVVAGIEAIDGPVAEKLAVLGQRVDRAAVTVIGHSAGGHLAVWAVARLGAATDASTVTTVVSQSGVLDLTVPGARDKESVVTLMGVPYEQDPQRYVAASPTHAPVVDALVVAQHTLDDESVPIRVSRDYVAGAGARGQRAELVELPGDHAAFLDISSPAHHDTVRILGLGAS